MNGIQLPLGETADERLFVARLQSGMQVEEHFLVSSKETRSTKSGKPYLKLKVGDRTGMLDCMVWEDAERIGAGFQSGDIVLIKGRTSEYAGRIQLEASAVQAGSDGLDPRDFLPCTYRDVDELTGFLHFHIESVYDSDYRALLDLIFGDEGFLARFAAAPAAKAFHHAYLGGLLEHTVSVAELCDHIAQQYPRVNRDLLITAALLHDAARWKSSATGGPSTTATPAGCSDM